MQRKKKIDNLRLIPQIYENGWYKFDNQLIHDGKFNK